VLDGWSNTKHNRLINVLAVHSLSAFFMYDDNFFGIEKTCKTILDYLLKDIDGVGPPSVSYTTRKEIKKIHKNIFLVTKCLSCFDAHFQRFC